MLTCAVDIAPFVGTLGSISGDSTVQSSECFCYDLFILYSLLYPVRDFHDLLSTLGIWMYRYLPVKLWNVLWSVESKSAYPWKTYNAYSSCYGFSAEQLCLNLAPAIPEVELLQAKSSVSLK